MDQAIESVSVIPLVSVICTVFNQEKTISDTLDSVFNQTYPALELLIIDNGSKDSSFEVIQDTLHKYSRSLHVLLVKLPKTENYCQAFNEVFCQATGEYFIDLSGDDLLFPTHIEDSVAKFNVCRDAWAVFSNVELYDVKRQSFSLFYKSLEGKEVKEGDLYAAIVAGNPVLSVSLLIDSHKFRQEGMYDPDLVYEDFDLMVRMSRKYPMYYTHSVGVRKLLHSQSFSAEQYRSKKSRMLPSTFRVCQKIQSMNRTEAERLALVQRVTYELKMAVISANYQVANDFVAMGRQLGVSSMLLWVSQLICWFRLDLSFILRLMSR
jgi:glycosyltransferase involved in cell wall biosynthesis